MIVFASDFDGTLFYRGETKGIADEDISAIRRFQAEGNAFGVCTGRSLQGLLLSSPKSMSYDFRILSSGALIVDRGGQPILKRYISRALVADINERYHDRANIVIESEEGTFTLSEPRYPIITKLSSMDELPGESFYGLSFSVETPGHAADIAAELNAVFAGQVSAFQNVTNIDVVAAGCSKGAGLRFVKEYYRAELTGGIGDSYNDISLLDAADRSFTFPFAPPEVRARADEIVDTIAAALARV